MIVKKEEGTDQGSGGTRPSIPSQGVTLLYRRLHHLAPTIIWIRTESLCLNDIKKSILWKINEKNLLNDIHSALNMRK